jgi:gamma-glutamyltranspeptidase/glutathione hydrolase
MNTRRTLAWGLSIGALVLLGVAPPPLSSATGGMVASDHVLASEAGAEVLRKGGNAIDAAVAAALASGVVQPAGSGLGGGGFAVFHDGREHRVLDFREQAPAAASAGMYLDEQGEVVPQASQIGGLAVGIPGEPRGLAQLVNQYGSLSLRDVARPAERLALRGFSAGDHLVHALESKPHMAGLLFDGVDLAVTLDQNLRRQALAGTINAWARSGGEALSVGWMARSQVDAVSAAGGLLTEQDLADYQPKAREPLVGTYRGYTVITMPPPSSGGAVLLQTLAVLEGHDLQQLGHGSSDHIHLLAEVFQHAYADRAAFMGDPDFVEVPVDRMLAPERIEEIQRSVWPTRTWSRDHYGTDAGIPEDAGTLHISVIDAEGLGVALTTTINTSFGSQVVDPETGILFNNEMDDFVAKPGVPNAFGLVGKESNAVAPGKRPLSSMTPTILLDPEGRVVMAVGGSGGPFIISSTLQVLSNVVDFGMDPEEAVSAPRMHHQWVPELLFLDEGVPLDVQRALQARGHELKQMPFFSAVQLVAADEHGLSAASDPRKGGSPARE